MIDNLKVTQVYHTQFLGIEINSRLNWNEHIKTVCSKVCKSSGIWHRTRKNLNAGTLLLLYQTLIQPYFDYCNIIWSVGESVRLEKLFVKQKKATRAITFAKWNANTDRLFANLRLLKLDDINVYQTSSFIYKSRHGLLPPHFCNLIVLNSEVHLQDKRNKNLIHQVAHRINARALSIRVYGAKIWNALPTFIQNSPTFPIFKKKM